MFFAHLSLSQLAEKDKSVAAFLCAGAPSAFFTLRNLPVFHRKSPSLLRLLLSLCLALLAMEEGASLSLVTPYLARYPHLAIMARLEVCCFVFVMTLLVASYNSFTAFEAEAESDNQRKKTE